MNELYPWLQEEWQALMKRAVQGLPHALLMTGSKGIGKQRFNQYLAQWLLCHKAKAEGLMAPCSECQSCKLWQVGNHPDVLVCHPEEGSRQIRVDSIRKVNEFLAQTSQISDCQVVLIRPVEVMNLNAANALLKTLEEPAGRSYLLLDTERYGSVLPTIRSRCQRISFATPTAEQGKQWLSQKGIQALDAEHALRLNHGAPLAALAWLEEEKEAHLVWLNQLQQWDQQDISLIELSSQWQKQDLQRVLTWLYMVILDVLKAQLKVDDAQLMLPQITPKLFSRMTLDLTKLLALQKKIQTILGRLMSGTGNYNKQLLIESVLIDWQYLPSASKQP